MRIHVEVTRLCGSQQASQLGDGVQLRLRLADLGFSRRRSGCGLDLGQMLERHDAVRVLVCLRKPADVSGDHHTIAVPLTELADNSCHWPVSGEGLDTPVLQRQPGWQLACELLSAPLAQCRAR